MKSGKTALLLNILAGLICIGIFVTRYVRNQETDYFILVAGIFVSTAGLGRWYYGKKHNDGPNS